MLACIGMLGERWMDLESLLLREMKGYSGTMMLPPEYLKRHAYYLKYIYIYFISPVVR